MPRIPGAPLDAKAKYAADLREQQVAKQVRLIPDGSSRVPALGCCVFQCWAVAFIQELELRARMQEQAGAAADRDRGYDRGDARVHDLEYHRRQQYAADLDAQVRERKVPCVALQSYGSSKGQPVCVGAVTVAHSIPAACLQ